MNLEDIYNHRACERCHAQKLRCRPQTNEKCIRCTKANTKCVARPPRRVRRTENAPERRSESEEKVHLSASPEIGTHFHEVAGGEKVPSVYIHPLAPNLTVAGTDVALTDSAEACPASVSLMDWSTETDFSHFDFTDISTNGNTTVGLAGGDGTFSEGLMDSTWTDFKFDPVEYASIHQYSKEGLPPLTFREAVVEGPSTGVNTEYPVFCKDAWVEDLTRLNSRVSKHDEALFGGTEQPSSSTSAPSESSSVSNENRPLTGIESRFLDETLALTTDLIRLLDQLVSHTCGRLQGDTQGVNGFQPRFLQTSIDNLHEPKGCITPPAEDKRKQSPIHGDQFTILLLMSCYMRLLGIYENFFTHIGDIKSQAADPRQAQISLPDITVGSFSLLSSPSLKVSLIIELVSFLVGHIGHTIEMTTPPTAAITRNAYRQPERSSKSSSAMTDVISSTHNAVREREKELMEAMSRIRRTLMRSRPGTSIRGDVSSYF